jgi:hypothetical protein
VIEARVLRFGVSPLFLFTLTLSRHENGTHAGLSFHIYKFGVHLALSTID